MKKDDLDVKIEIILQAAAQIFGISPSTITVAKFYIRRLDPNKKRQFIEYLKKVLNDD